MPRIPGAVCEDAVNFYLVDRNEKMMEIVRLGAAVNDEFKPSRSQCLSYEGRQ